MDGTTEKLATIVSGTSTAANEVSKYDIVSYTISSDGYKLTLVANAAQTSTSANDKVITNGSPAMKFAGTTLPADGETIFLTETKKSSTSNTTYSVYEGIANVPTAKMLSDDETWYAAYKKAGDSAYTVVFLLNNDKVQMSSGNKDVIFVKGNSDGKSYTKDLGYYFAYTAYLDGEKFELKSENAITEWLRSSVQRQGHPDQLRAEGQQQCKRYGRPLRCDDRRHQEQRCQARRLRLCLWQGC